MTAGPRRSRPSRGPEPFGLEPSNIRDQVEVFIILVLAAVALAHVLDPGDELDRLDPLDHLVAELVLDPQAQGSPVDPVERPAVHLVGDDALRVKHVGHAMAIVVFTAVKALAERMKYAEPHVRPR